MAFTAFLIFCAKFKEFKKYNNQGIPQQPFMVFGWPF
jgi:hypothetical protein